MNKNKVKTSRRVWLWGAAILALVMLGAFHLRDAYDPVDNTVSTAGSTPPSATTANSPAAKWTSQHSRQVEEMCSTCHLFPPAESLPRSRWTEVIATMAEVPGSTLTPSQLALATAFYIREAPEQLDWVPPAPILSTRLSFTPESSTPPAFGPDMRISASANVSFVYLSGAPTPDLLLAEMRSRSLSLLKAGLGAGQRQPVVIQREVNYPVHAAVVDMNGDGRQDVIVASLGDMNPSNHQKGSVALLIARADGGFDHHVVLESVGRVADARAADFDGDGDQDLVVAVFGWRGPGALMVLENQTRDWRQPSFQQRGIDTRDGWIHTEITDLDGDSRPDFVALLSQEHEQVIAYLNRGGLRFEAGALHRAPHPAWGYSGLQLVDMDNDDDVDVLLSNGDALDDYELKPYTASGGGKNRGGLNFAPHHIAQLYGCERAVAADMETMATWMWWRSRSCRTCRKRSGSRRTSTRSSGSSRQLKAGSGTPLKNTCASTRP
ncbi:MAG: hypothetical protein CM1200mP20_10450 [Pseudomonadota bacterium]|nr:MAG: hypothetical protein CM1200mP20_10450 [Pseudomonadota bacterium]